MSQWLKKYGKTAFRMVPALLFFLFVLCMLVGSLPGPVKQAIRNTPMSFAGLVQLSESLETTLQNHVFGKHQYINLNGLVTRGLGINSLNEVERNGNAAAIMGPLRIEEPVDVSKVIGLQEFLAERDIPLLCLLAPNTNYLYDTRFAPGYDSPGRDYAKQGIAALQAAGVTTVDMDVWFEENGWSYEDVFFRTDHHWKPEAALQAVRQTMGQLEALGLGRDAFGLLDEAQWNKTVYEEMFLGSRGKRVGVHYAGVDDLTVYTPAFPLEVQYSGLRSVEKTWEHYETMLDTSYVEGYEAGELERLYFDLNPYCTYGFADYPLSVSRNEQAANDARVVVLGDSFKLPYHYFLSTQFREIYRMDLRYYRDGTFAQFAEAMQPDLVIICENYGSLAGEDHNAFGLEAHEAALAESARAESRVIYQGDVRVSAGAEESDGFTVVCEGLQPGQTYTLTVARTMLQGSSGGLIQLTLQDLTVDYPVCERFFEAGAAGAQKWFFTVPEDNPEGEYALYLFAGTRGQTNQAAAEVTGVCLQTGIIP